MASETQGTQAQRGTEPAAAAEPAGARAAAQPDLGRATAPAPGPAAAEVWRAWDEVVATARRTTDDGLVVGTSGNVSARVGDTVLVTPSGIPYDELGPDDIVGVDLEGHPLLGHRRPTSELPMHLAIYRATHARAVVHTHAVHATAVSTLVTELPAVHYMMGALGGPVRVAPYALYGSDELARHMLAALRDRTGCLLRNHGTIVYGDTLRQAYDRTAQLEWMCRVWLTAVTVPGHTPTLLTEAQLDEATHRLRTYGQPSS
ncbi:class II aldolase/adducin family protein [Streptomyces zagrosensis]|uniref:L-fuculose-phosphate aldolase n=1 Tax=Streptomyces zagrosensis TaxID=1042984 RepID=A0A7W9Q4Y4_9ACTN|nr:class II aldolase/adducin family protein [Streptomyces zagrosensis]MBB5933686.1 L-fuculose-phosphate aldolase [Streptomyces zagrosensis]